MKLYSPMLVSEASVKLNQMVRISGQPATRNSTTSIGARKSSAERTLARVSSLPPEAVAWSDRSVMAARPPIVRRRRRGAVAKVSAAHQPRRLTPFSSLSSEASDASAVLCPDITLCTAFQKLVETRLYFSPVTREGRATALVKVL